MKAIATHLGAEYRFLGFVEGAIVVDSEHTHRITGMIRECKPDHVLTHQPTDSIPTILRTHGRFLVSASWRALRKSNLCVQEDLLAEQALHHGAVFCVNHSG
jgi:LmbE family N-acetylglucosaminyl deacetylase